MSILWLLCIPLQTRVLIAYCGSKDISACICICGVDPKSPSNVEETFKLKGARINHANFQNQTSTPEKDQIPRNEFQLTTSDNVTLEFRLQNGRNCFDWTKLLTILTEFPHMRVPKEPQTPVTFHSKPDPYLYGSGKPVVSIMVVRVWWSLSLECIQNMWIQFNLCKLIWQQCIGYLCYT